MPGLTDLAALPTSWALTLWDALPVFLSVECAIAILILGVIPQQWKTSAWMISAFHLAGGLIYLEVFDSALVVPLLVLAGIVALTTWRRSVRVQQVPAPPSPYAGLRVRAVEVISAVAASSAAAAVVKVLVGPYVGDGNPIWFAFAAGIGLVPFGTLGTAAIPALASSSAANSEMVGIIILISAAARPVIRHYFHRLSSLRTAASSPS